MPELPEVETVRRGLEKLILNAKIEAVNNPYPKLITGDRKAFLQTLIGATLIKFDRRGKYLLHRLDNGYTIVSHLRMEGQYSVENATALPYKHTELIIKLDDGRQVFYNDTRRFGKMTLAKTNQESLSVPALGQLGPEPIQEDLTVAYLTKVMNASNQKIKAFLLDQTKIAGIGNIYADEVLWQSQIQPTSVAKAIPKNQIIILHENIIREIARATKAHGTTVHSFSNVFGEVGQFQNQLSAYGRKDQPCLRCGNLMQKIKVAQRGTTFCDKCQVKYE